MLCRIAACLVLIWSVAAAAGQQQEKLLFGINAYDPVPSPDGRFVAYVVTGRTPDFGGLGRSSLLSQVWFCGPAGEAPQNPGVQGFLGEWLPDSSAIVSFRDWRFALVEPGGSRDSESFHQGRNVDDLIRMPERVAYLSKLGNFIWIEQSNSGTELQSRTGPFAELKNVLIPSAALIVPSPDERYLAIGGPEAGQRLWVYDTEKRTVSDLGSITIHPDSEWDYFKPGWNPWFPDGKHLAFFSGGSLYVVSPDGKDRRKLLQAVDAGLAVPSLDGTLVAYAAFSRRPLKLRKDLSFWGASALWVVPAAGGTPRQVTKASLDTTYDLRWLTKDSLIFDRLPEAMFNEGARIWTVSVGNQ